LWSSAHNSFGVVVMMVKLRILSPAGERQVSAPIAARYGLRRTFVRELRAGEGIGGKSEPA